MVNCVYGVRVKADGIVLEPHGIDGLLQDFKIIVALNRCFFKRQAIYEIPEFFGSGFGCLFPHACGKFAEHLRKVACSAGIGAVILVGNHVGPQGANAKRRGMSMRNLVQAGKLVAHGMARRRLRDVDCLAGEVRRLEHLLVAHGVVGQVRAAVVKNQTDCGLCEILALVGRVHGPERFDSMAEGVHHRGLALVRRQRIKYGCVEQHRLRDAAIVGHGLFFAIVVHYGEACRLAAGPGSRGNCYKRNVIGDNFFMDVVATLRHRGVELDALGDIYGAPAADSENRVAGIRMENIDALHDGRIVGVRSKVPEVHGIQCPLTDPIVKELAYIQPAAGISADDQDFLYPGLLQVFEKGRIPPFCRNDRLHRRYFVPGISSRISLMLMHRSLASSERWCVRMDLAVFTMAG